MGTYHERYVACCGYPAESLKVTLHRVDIPEEMKIKALSAADVAMDKYVIEKARRLLALGIPGILIRRTLQLS